MASSKISTYVLVTLLFVTGIGLLSGLYSGLIRMGFLAGTSEVISPLAHGPLMINGFLGMLIGLERAAALEKNGHTWHLFYWVFLPSLYLSDLRS